MSNSANTIETLNGHMKEAYADKILDLIPDGVKLYNMIGFSRSADKLGGNYNQPVTLSMEHGFTYGGNGGTAFALNAAIAASSENAQVKGVEVVLRSYLSVGAVSRSQNSKTSFIQESKYVVANMLKSFMRRLEVMFMYGQADTGLGQIESVATVDLILEPEEWAAGIWGGSENMKIQIYNAAGSTLRGEFEIVSVNFDTRKLTLDSDAAAAGVIATDIIFYSGAKSKECVGLHKILSNSSGTLFNIDASNYSLWRSSQISVGTNFTGGEAVLSFDKIEESVARMMEKGLVDGKLQVICNPKSWKNLLTEQSAKRSYDSSYSSDKVKQGAKGIEFFGPTGMIEIQSSIFCKEGYAYVISEDSFERIGSSDVRLDMPGFEGKFIKVLESVNAYELRSYSDQALFCNAPGHNALLKFIKS